MLAFAVVTVGRFVGISTAFGPEVGAVRIGEEIWIHPGKSIGVFDGFWIVAVLGVVAFFERVEYGVDGDFALLVAIHGINVDLLKKEEDDKNANEDNADDEFENCEAFFAIHIVIY